VGHCAIGYGAFFDDEAIAQINIFDHREGAGLTRFEGPAVDHAFRLQFDENGISAMTLCEGEQRDE
jgi:hypothetical protein